MQERLPPLAEPALAVISRQAAAHPVRLLALVAAALVPSLAMVEVRLPDSTVAAAVLLVDQVQQP